MMEIQRGPKCHWQPWLRTTRTPYYTNNQAGNFWYIERWCGWLFWQAKWFVRIDRGPR